MNEDIRKKVMQELGLEKLTPERQEEMLLTIGKLIFQGVLIRVMGLLSEKDKDDFDKLLMEKVEDEEAVFNFLKNKIPNLNELVDEEVASFKKELAEFNNNFK